MPKSKLQREFQADEEGTVVVPKESLPEPTISITALKKTVKRPMSDKQRENAMKLVEANRIRWASKREEKEKQKEEALSAVRQEEEKLIEQGTHVRMKVKEKIQKPRKAEPKPEPKPVRKPKEYTDTEEDTTEAEESEDEPLPPRRAVRQARKQMRTLQKIDEVIEQSANPYMARLSSRWM